MVFMIELMELMMGIESEMEKQKPLSSGSFTKLVEVRGVEPLSKLCPHSNVYSLV